VAIVLARSISIKPARDLDKEGAVSVEKSDSKRERAGKGDKVIAATCLKALLVKKIKLLNSCLDKRIL
jgi:GTP cyclohydrolase II